MRTLCNLFLQNRLDAIVSLCTTYVDIIMFCWYDIGSAKYGFDNALFQNTFSNYLVIGWIEYMISSIMHIEECVICHVLTFVDTSVSSECEGLLFFVPAEILKGPEFVYNLAVFRQSFDFFLYITGCFLVLLKPLLVSYILVLWILK